MKRFFQFIQRERLYILLLIFVLLIVVATATPSKAPVSAKQVYEDASAKKQRAEKLLREDGRLALKFVVASLVILLVLFVGSILDITLLARKLRKRPIGIRTREVGSVRWTIWDVARVVILFLFFGYMIVITESLLSRSVPILKNDNLRAVLNSSLLDLLSVVFIIYFTVRQYGEKLTQLGLTMKNFFKNVLYGVMTYVAVVPVLVLVLIITAFVVHLIQYVPKEQVVVEIFMREKNPVFLLYLSLFAAVAGPIAEELFFRGFMYSAVKKYTGVFGATIVTAAIFAYLHGHVVGFLPIMVLGIALAYIYEKTGSLVSSITVHMLHNLGMVFLVFLAKAAKG